MNSTYSNLTFRNGGSYLMYNPQNSALKFGTFGKDLNFNQFGTQLNWFEQLATNQFQLLANDSIFVSQFNQSGVFLPKKGLGVVNDRNFLFNAKEKISFGSINYQNVINWTKKNEVDDFVKRYITNESSEPVIVELDKIRNSDSSKEEKKSKFVEIMEVIIEFGNTTANVINALKGNTSGSGLQGMTGTGTGGTGTGSGGNGSGSGGSGTGSNNTLLWVGAGIAGTFLVTQLLKED